MIFKNAAIHAGSTVWSLGSGMARELSRRGLLSSKKLEGLVIGVGNLQLGGAGKTPLVAQIAREAIGLGKSVCILSRGYGGSAEGSGTIIRPGDAAADPLVVGDEVALLHDEAPEAWLGVGSDRIASYTEVVRENGKPFDVVILDDGFQHWKIQKDLEILAVTSKGSGEVLHRDFKNQSAHADLIVWTKGEKEPEGIQWDVKVRYQLNVTPEDRTHSYWLISGIADPNAFRDTVLKAGLQVRRQIPLSDHVNYSQSQIDSLMSEARSNGCRIALTGKDWVKWRTFSTQDVLILEPEIIFEKGRERWRKVLWGL